MKTSVFIMIQPNYNSAAVVAASITLIDRACIVPHRLGGGVEDLTHPLPLVFMLFIDSRMRQHCLQLCTYHHGPHTPMDS